MKRQKKRGLVWGQQASLLGVRHGTEILLDSLVLVLAQKQEQLDLDLF